MTVPSRRGRWMPATVSGEVAGVTYTLYENGMLKVGTTVATAGR